MYKIEDIINKVHNADCLEFMKNIPDKSVDLVLTDPPYGMKFRSNRRQIKHAKIENDNNLDWLDELSKQFIRILKDGCHAYIFCSFHNIDKFKQAFDPIKNILIWEKNNTGMGDLFGDYAPLYEMCLFVSKGNKLNDDRDANIMRFNKTKNNLHPTEKPVEMFKYLITKSSNVGGIVFDPFLGSGTTAVACKQLERNFIGIEIAKEYCDIANERLKQELLF